MPRRSANPLHWLPFPVDRWLGELAGGLRPEQKGALLDLLCTAWQQQPPCSLPGNDVYLAGRSGLGAQWRKHRAAIMTHFTPTDDGRVVCQWLRDIYDEQHVKYENRSRANRENRLGTVRSTDGDTKQGTNRSANRAQNRELEGRVPPVPEGTGVEPPPAPDGARAPDGAALVGATNGNGDYLNRAETREALARAGVRPADAADSARPVTPLAEARAAIEEQAQSYGSMLHDAVDDWLELNPTQRAEIELDAAMELGATDVDDVPLLRLTAHRGLVEQAVRQRAEWPTERAWDGTPFGPQLTTT